MDVEILGRLVIGPHGILLELYPALAKLRADSRDPAPHVALWMDWRRAGRPCVLADPEVLP